jgi:hypothetical protein
MLPCDGIAFILNNIMMLMVDCFGFGRCDVVVDFYFEFLPAKSRSRFLF